MKIQKTILFLILISSQLYGQMQIDAGQDTAICIDFLYNDTFRIGGNPTASGGIEPYTYTWSKFPNDQYYYEASWFLSDTTIANPTLINFYDFTYQQKFKLTVRDNYGTQLVDSINLMISAFVGLEISFDAFINKGDTAMLENHIFGGIPPLKYSWSPNYNISDTSIEAPKAWPDTNVKYSVILIDSIGCVSEPGIFYVIIIPSGITQSKYTKYRSTIFPNPIDNNSVIYCDSEINHNLEIQIINMNGQVILSDKLIDDRFLICDKISKNGYYLFLILDNSEIVSYGQFIKR